MKSKIRDGAPDAAVLRVLLKKQAGEAFSAFKDKKTDYVGLLLKIAIYLCFTATFVFMFLRFSGVYLDITLYGKADAGARAYELLTALYQAVFLLTVIGAVGQINTTLFHDDENMLYSALPINGSTLFASRLISVYLKQLFVAFVFVFTVNITFAPRLHAGAWYYFATVLTTVFWPFLSISVASFIVLPLRKAVEFFKNRFVLSFTVTTLLLAGGFTAYYFVLTAVKQILMKDDLRYFFTEKVMNAIADATECMIPARFAAGFVLGRDAVSNGLFSLLIAVLCAGLAVLMIKLLFRKAMQSKTQGRENFQRKAKPFPKRRSPFVALLKKEFIIIFRTSSYMFSYFAVSVIMPLMVFFCLSLGDNMVKTLVGVDTSLELSLILTMLFGAITNTFCATNISRDGAMFYCVKAMPVGAKQVVFSKVTLCLFTAVFSNVLNAILVGAGGFISAGDCVLLALSGILYSFAQICYATRADLKYARFSDGDGEISQSSALVSQIIVIGFLSIFVFGGALLYVNVKGTLSDVKVGDVTRIVATVAALLAGVFFYIYMVRKLAQKYYEFSGGY